MAKNYHEIKKTKKMNRINNHGPFFGRFNTQIIDFGVKVHMGTLGPVGATVGGQKWPEMTLIEDHSKKVNIISFFFAH